MASDAGLNQFFYASRDVVGQCFDVAVAVFFSYACGFKDVMFRCFDVTIAVQSTYYYLCLEVVHVPIALVSM